MVELIYEYQHLLVWMGVCSAVIFLISLSSLPWLVAKIPEDYFSPQKRQPTQWKAQRPAVVLSIEWADVFAAKNSPQEFLLLAMVSSTD